MALFMLQMTSLGRSSGRRATSAAAYRAGERIRDERSGKVYSHTKRDDVLHTQIVLPVGAEPSNPSAAAYPSWATDRAALWNAAERAETRKNSRVAREFLVTLPPELNDEQRLTLARRLSHEIADRYKVAVDLAVHAPRAGGDPRNHHAHLLATTREMTANGLGRKTGFDMTDAKRHQQGLLHVREEIVELRARWAAFTNDALRDAGLEVRVDHRSLRAQGIDREPQPTIPFVARQIERRGGHSVVAERIRAQYAARVALRLTRQVEQSLAAPQAQGQTQLAAAQPRETPRSVEEIQRQARENWLKLRASQGQDVTAPALDGAGRESAIDRPVKGRERHGPDNDFGL